VAYRSTDGKPFFVARITTSGSVGVKKSSIDPNRKTLMNRLLASALSALNVLFAGVIIASSIMVGKAAGQGSTLYEALGLIAGIGVAAVFCGVIAFLTLVERHLRILAEPGQIGVSAASVFEGAGARTVARSEPTF
jgi:hypothetical protein